MIFYTVIVYCVFLLLYSKVVTAHEGKIIKPSKNKKDVENTFANLLRSIVKVNEERLQALKKITQLQDYMLTKNKLKNNDDEYDSFEDEDNRIILAFADTPRLRRAEDETITRAVCHRILERNHFHLRSSHVFKQACHRHSLGLCVNACKKSVAHICEKLECNYKTIRDFKNECHYNCRFTFEHD